MSVPLPSPRMSGTTLVSRAFGIQVVDVSTTNINPTEGAFAVANNLRIASLSIAAYEYATSYVSPSHSDLLAVQLFYHSPC